MIYYNKIQVLLFEIYLLLSVMFFQKRFKHNYFLKFTCLFAVIFYKNKIQTQLLSLEIHLPLLWSFLWQNLFIALQIHLPFLWSFYDTEFTHFFRNSLAPAVMCSMKIMIKSVYITLMIFLRQNLLISLEIHLPLLWCDPWKIFIYSIALAVMFFTIEFTHFSQNSLALAVMCSMKNKDIFVVYLSNGFLHVFYL